MTNAPPRRSIAALILGIVFGLIGLVLTGGGAWLLISGGSPYYLVTGIALIVAGVLLARGRKVGGWLYIVIFAVTLLWAYWEVGLNPWALVPRVVAPLVLLIALQLVWPTLDRSAGRWRRAWVGVAVTFAVAIGFFWSIAGNFIPPMLQGLPDARYAMADPSIGTTGADWPAYGGTNSARRYSPLAQITPANVGNLKRAWLIHTGDLPASAQIRNTYGAENTPLKIGDTLYVCTPKSMVIALDPATGKQKWRFDPRVSDEAIPYTAACRGVS